MIVIGLDPHTHLRKRSIFSNYWIRLSRIWRILQVEETALLTSLVRNDRILGQQQLFMVNYACGFNQSETGKYFEWIINTTYATLLSGITWGVPAWRVTCIFSIYSRAFSVYSKKIQVTSDGRGLYDYFIAWHSIYSGQHNLVPYTRSMTGRLDAIVSIVMKLSFSPLQRVHSYSFRGHWWDLTMKLCTAYWAERVTMRKLWRQTRNSLPRLPAKCWSQLNVFIACSWRCPEVVAGISERLSKFASFYFAILQIT